MIKKFYDFINKNMERNISLKELNDEELTYEEENYKNAAKFLTDVAENAICKNVDTTIPPHIKQYVYKNNKIFEIDLYDKHLAASDKYLWSYLYDKFHISDKNERKELIKKYIIDKLNFNISIENIYHITF